MLSRSRSSVLSLKLWSKTFKFDKTLLKRTLATKSSVSSFLNNIQIAPPDKILGITEFYNNDTNPKKVNLTVGIYKDNNGMVTTLPSVAKAQDYLESPKDLNLSYLPITGNKAYANGVKDFLFKDSCPKTSLPYLTGDKISFTQTLSGTGAIAVTAKFLSKFVSNNIWLPNYSWANHLNIFKSNGFNDINFYSYYNKDNKNLTIDKWLNELKDSHTQQELKNNDNKPQCILLHACCHNPTGLDPTRDEWIKIIDTINELGMVPIIDMAYQGLESGNLINDAYLLNMCLKKGNWTNGLYLCQSFAKNMGLYGERVGSLSIVMPLESSKNVKLAIDSQIKPIIRSIYSSPPGFGSRIVNIVLSDKNLKNQWLQDVQNMVNRLKSIRIQLNRNLNWPSLIDYERQHGMFYFTNFTVKQVEQLKEDYSIYLTSDGRLSLSGINDSNVDYVSEALKNVSTEN